MKVIAIATNTFKEVIRDKIFYSLVFFAALIVGASVVLSTLTLGERSKIIEDLSLASISFFGVIIAVFVGIGLVYQELEKKTIYTIISKPIHRHQFLFGKFLGLAMVLFVYVVVMSACFLVVLYASTGVWGGGLLIAVLLSYVELMIITSAALLFSTFSTPSLSASYTLAIYIIGHATGDLKGLGANMGPGAARTALEFFYYLLPNLENFNVKAQVTHNIPVSPEYVLMVLVYGLLYVSGLMALSAVVFHKRNFK